MTSYAHDADVVVYNYDTRSPGGGSTSLSAITGAFGDSMSTTKLSLRDAIVSIHCNKTKSTPQGSFTIILKPTQDWAKIIVPGSWCSIFMSDRPLTDKDYTSSATVVTIESKNSSVDNVISPLKMVGIIMSVRVQKQRSGDGATTLTYTICGYDFGYVFTSQIYINYLLRDMVGSGKLQPVFADITFPTDDTVFGDPVKNVKNVLNAWSAVSGGKLSIISPDAPKVKPPPIRQQVPSEVAELFGTGSEILQFITSCVGLDTRESKVINIGSNGSSDDFKAPLIGEKPFWVWKLILHNTLWGMIGEYLNPLMNEAYCDLHPTKSETSIPNPLGPPTANLRPMLIVRQLPFSTPNYKKIWAEELSLTSKAAEPFPITKLTDLPRTIIPPEKVLAFDVGYSEYERTNFVELNGFIINGPANGIDSGPFNAANFPAYNEESIKRFGVRAKMFMGCDYGVTRERQDTAGLWRPLIVDWWFHANKFASGTLECVGLSEHIAIGENIELTEEGILAHIESYTHTFSVDNSNGNRVFRTSIDFVKGISAESTSASFKYIYGEVDAPSVGFSGISKSLMNQESIVTDDVQKIASFTPQGNGGLKVK